MSVHENVITIGRLSQLTRVKIETIRYYERIGLLNIPMRSASGRRLYTDKHRQTLLFIRRSRELGFQIADARALLALSAQEGTEAQGEAKALTLHHLANVRAKIATLKELERALEDMTEVCKPGQQDHCPIVMALSAESDGIQPADQVSRKRLVMG